MASKSPIARRSRSPRGGKEAPYETQEIRLANGALVYIKVPPSLSKGQPVPTDFSSVVGTIEGISSSLIDVWKKIKPSKATVEFGLQLEGGSGQVLALFANAKTTAHITVTLEWGGADATT
jgi:ribosomal protein L21E